MNVCRAYLESLVDAGGPLPTQYAEANQWANDLYARVDAGEINADSIDELRQIFSPAHSSITMHGMAHLKPHGYHGDYEIIDRHYTQAVCQNPQFRQWDLLWHWGAAAQAVRNRPNYLRDVIARHISNDKPGPVPGPRSPFAERAKQWSSGASLKVAEPNPIYGHAK